MDYDNYYPELCGTVQFNRFWKESHSITSWGLATILGIEKCAEDKVLDSDLCGEAERLLHQSTLSRYVDNFQTFVVDVIVAAFENNPDLISPKQTTKIANIFRFSDMGELRSFVIDESASEFGYKNVVEIDKDIRSRYGFGIIDGKLTRLRVRRLIEIRNVIVHNRGYKTHKFINQVGGKYDKVGDLVTFPHPTDAGTYLERVAVDIDEVAKARFKLQREYGDV